MTEFNRRYPGLLFGIGFLLLGLVSLSSFLTLRSYFGATELRKASRKRIEAIANLLSSMKDAETGQRGYLLTGRDSYLVPFQNAQAEVPGMLSGLRDPAGSDPKQTEQMNRLELDIQRKLAELKQTVALRRNGGLAAALEVVDNDSGKNNMDEIRHVCAEMTADEDARLNDREAQAAMETRQSIVVLILGTTLVFLLVGGSALLTQRAITQLGHSEARLLASTQELTLSNRDLEQFAYVASHDLQEPLRMVSNYCQLLSRRYVGKLDADADDFIRFAVDGAQRMQSLIDDLLSYSRVGSRRAKPQRIQSGLSLHTALANLESRIKESGGVVTHDDPLPEIDADPQQLTQLFQNLIGNALKFRGPEAPRIQVRAINHDGDWQFAVQDNGIGIDPDYHDQIFALFKRLNSKADYPGTGIGLAICKKIVDTHGGKIWVSSKAGQGSTFYFQFPRTVA